MNDMSQWYIGTIGFSYKDWVGEFYPSSITQREYLPYYSKVFNSVEIDTTFHAIPRPTTVQSWYAVTPPEFKFCVKTPRIVTHDLGLKGTNGLMNEFLESISPLQGKTGPILIQLPPKYSQENISDLDIFLASLPDTHQYAIEFRHPSWYNEKTNHLLSHYQICWVTVDYPNLPRQINLTANFIYIRWIGINGMYRHHFYERVDKTAQLSAWIELINPYLEHVPCIFGFFNNDYAGFAAGTCKRFIQLAGISNIDQNMTYQERLF
ncbi:MAG: DUF72 domain-containing protein [Anaerolineales bacterium]